MSINPNAKPYNLEVQRAALLAQREKIDALVQKIDARLAEHAALMSKLAAVTPTRVVKKYPPFRDTKAAQQAYLRNLEHDAKIAARK